LIVATAAVEAWAPLVELALAPDTTGVRSASDVARGAKRTSRMSAQL
jgi:hypothetical protein